MYLQWGGIWYQSAKIDQASEDKEKPLMYNRQK